MTLAIFVVHYSKLKERKDKLQRTLDALDYPSFWVTEKSILFDEALFTHNYEPFGVKSRLIAMDRSNNSRTLVKSRFQARLEGYLLFLASYLKSPKIRFLTDNPYPEIEPYRILELSIMHFECLLLAKEKGLDWALVIEDDAILDLNYVNRVLKDIEVLQLKRPTWYNLSAGANLARTVSDPMPDNLGMYRVKPWASRCSSGYLINANFIEAASELLQDHGIPDWTAIDVIYQIIMRRTRTKVYWQDPPSIQQGSEIGVFASNLKVNRE